MGRVLCRKVAPDNIAQLWLGDLNRIHLTDIMSNYEVSIGKGDISIGNYMLLSVIWA